MKTTTLTFAALCAFSAQAFSDPIEFDLKDAKGVNSITFELESLLEPIYGNAAGISGSVKFDPCAPEKTTGQVILDTSSLHVANKLMREHMHGKDWMDVAKFPAIIFDLEKLEAVQKEGDNYNANAVGTMKILAISKKITVPVTLTFLKGRLAERNLVEGDLLVIRSKFVVNRDDFGINAGQKLLKVANRIDIRVGIAGANPYGK
jgi:polyisoprenoid-binding protein YceI